MLRIFREPVNGLTHAAGALLSVAGLSVLMAAAVTAGKTTHVVAFSVYGASLILLYTASALYHLLRVSQQAIAVLRRIDHMMIYILIAGTYTPVCLIVLPGMWGIGMLVFIWTLAAAGVLFTLFLDERAEVALHVIVRRNGMVGGNRYRSSHAISSA